MEISVFPHIMLVCGQHTYPRQQEMEESPQKVLLVAVCSKGLGDSQIRHHIYAS